MGRHKTIEWGIVNGARVKALRIRKGLTRVYIANKLGISRQTVQNWELGKYGPQDDKLRGLAFLLNATIEELTGKQASTDDDDEGIDIELMFEDQDEQAETTTASDQDQDEPKTVETIAEEKYGLQGVRSITYEERQVRDARKPTSDLVALPSMVTGRTEADIIRDAVLQYAKGLDWQAVIGSYMGG